MTGQHLSDLRALLHALVNPSSNQAYVRDQQTLTDLYKQPEFFIALQTLAADTSLSPTERQLASVITSRELKTKWRSKTLVPEARKPEVRERLLTFLEEPDTAISRPQLTLLVSIARIDYPRQFPLLPTFLVDPLRTCISHIKASPQGQPLSSSTATVLLNTMWTINALVKEWRSVKLAAGAQVMGTLEEVFALPVGEVLQIWAQHQRDGGADWVLNEAGRYAFKTLARFGQWHWGKAKGLQSAVGIEHIKLVLSHSVHYAPLIQEQRLQLLQHPPSPATPEYNKLLHSLIKHLRAIGKWWRAMISTDAKGWCQLEGGITGVGWWWSAVGGVVAGSDGTVLNDDSDETPYPKRFLLLGMLLFKDILPILAHDHQETFTPEFIITALHLLVDKLLPLTSTDLEGLEDEPEEWLIAESNDEEAWAFEFRPCAERVLMALSNACRHLPHERKPIEPEMLKILAITESLPPNDLPHIIRKEAVYCAVGRLSRALASHGGLDFNAFLHGVGSWLGQGLPLQRILKRRVAWLIGQWVGSDEECAKLEMVWQILLHLVSERGESTDMAVNLTAATAIKECVDLWELDITYFLPYVQRTIEELIKLLGEASTLDGKRKVNDAIGVVIERTEDKIMPYLPTLARAIPTLWHSASGLEGEWLFKASLVVLTTKIVNAAKESSGDLTELVIPLIEESLQTPAKDHFEEDGIILWQAALHNAVSPYQPTAETGVIRLLPGLIHAIGENMDLLKSLLPLLDSYILLDSDGIIQNYGAAICSALLKAINASAKNWENIGRILASLNLIAQTAPLQALAGQLLESGMFNQILVSLEDDKASGAILSAYLGVLARIAMRDPTIYLQLVAEQARISGRDGHQLLEEALDSMWRNFDYIGETRPRKAVAMAAGSLITTGHPQAMERLDGEFMNIWLDVLGETVGAEAINHWKHDNPTAWGEIEHAPEGKRRTTLEDSDPAYAVSLKSFIMDVLNRAQAVGLEPYWTKCDEGAKNSLQKFLA